MVTNRTPNTLMQPRRQGRGWLWLALLVVLILAVLGIVHRLYHSHALAQESAENSIIGVTLVTPKNGPATEDLTLPGTVQAWHEAPIYARVDGYLKDWLVDIGAPVQAGQLLGEIETPETDQQLKQAEADLQNAIAASALAKITAERDTALLQEDSIARQTADEAVSDAASKAAAVASARANRDRLRQTVGFKKMLAPFAGTVTARNVDTGALVTANTGSASATGSTASRELFHVADTRHLRIYVQVPETDAGSLLAAPQPGNATPTNADTTADPVVDTDPSRTLVAQLEVAEHPGQTFPAMLWRTAGAIDPTTRTLLAQFVVDNPSNTLLAGGYTTVHLHLPPKPGSVRVPVNALIFRGTNGASQGLQVATVVNNHAVLHAITPGRDYGTEMEILAGLPASTSVVLNPPDSLTNGQPVRIIVPSATTPVSGSAAGGKEGAATQPAGDSSATTPAKQPS